MIATDKKLKQDLVCDPGSSGLAIGADGVKLDLNGHTISGSGGGTAGVLAAGRENIKIVNGRIRGFDRSVQVGTVNGATLRKLDVKDAEAESVVLNNVTDGELIDSRLRAPGNSVNVLVNGSSALVEVRENVVRGGKIFLEDGDELSAIANDIADPNIGGIEVDDVGGGVVRGNHVVEAGIAAGIAVRTDAVGTRVGRNVVEGGFSSGIFTAVQSEAVRISHNKVRDTDASGIIVGVMSTDMVARKNDVRRAGGDGITVGDDDALIVRNTANRNTDYGIESASSNGSDNIAKNNGNAAQCTPSSLCS